MKSEEIRKQFFDFYTSSPRNHAVIPNVSLVPVNDPTILFTNSGMFPLVPYLLGEEHPQGTRLCNFQRCLRTGREDIEEIGDLRHTLMFEMMGNWSLGDYFKETQIPNVMDLYHKHFGLDINKLYVTVFAGDDDAPRDDDAIKYWKESFGKYGLAAEFSENIHAVADNSDKPLSYRIFPYPKKKNWWQRGEAPGELGGPDSEIFFDTGTKHDNRFGEKCHVNCDCGRFIEVGNSVFIQYKLSDELKWVEIPQKNVDFGGGFERVVMVSQGLNDIFATDLFMPIIKHLEDLSGKKYKADDSAAQQEIDRSFRIVADHIRGSVFIIADGIKPSNKDQGYILRSLIRRMIRYSRVFNIQDNFTKELASVVINRYKDWYPHLSENSEIILQELEKEENKFAKSLQNGLKELQKLTAKQTEIDGNKAFYIYETYGFPIEMILEELKVDEKRREQILSEFEIEKKKHMEQSRAGAEKKFKGGLADTSEQTTMLHTAHHLLLAALQLVLGDHVKQRGSNITAERLRIDISHSDKITPEELTEVEGIVNENIKRKLEVVKKIMPKAEAEKIGAEMEFGKKYGDLVNVYMIEDKETGEVISKEFCGGPHVANTGELAKMGQFKIIKEESSGSGIRRIKATLSN